MHVPCTTHQMVLVDIPSPTDKDLMGVPAPTAPRGPGDLDSTRHNGPPVIPQLPSLSLSSPLLFESAPTVCSSSTPIPQIVLQPASIMCQHVDKDEKSLLTETFDSSEDNDVTPPLSPQQNGSPTAIAMPRTHHLVDINLVTSASRQSKKNVRFAKAKRSIMEIGDSSACEKQQACPVQYAQIICSCREPLCPDQGKVILHRLCTITVHCSHYCNGP